MDEQLGIQNDITSSHISLFDFFSFKLAPTTSSFTNLSWPLPLDRRSETLEDFLHHAICSSQPGRMRPTDRSARTIIAGLKHACRFERSRRSDEWFQHGAALSVVL